MQIRRALPDDGPAFTSLVHALAEFEKLPPPDDAACARLLEHAFADPPRYELWVGGLGDPDATDPEAADPEAADVPSVAAYAVTFTTYSTFLARPTLYLEDIFVHPRARRRGLATFMMQQLQSVARERGCGRFEWTVLEWNEDAKALYDKLGAQVLGDWQLMRITLV